MRNRLIRAGIVGIVLAFASGAAIAGNTVLFSSKTGDIVFPITPTTIDGMAIGATTPAAGHFTTLGATGAVSLNPANAAVSLAPTGTGAVTINPATAGTMDNVTIGATTAKPGTFTAVTSAYITATTFFNASTANTLTAAGTTRADALALTKAINNVTTAGLNSGVVLPSAANVGEGGTVIVYNNGVNAIKIYAAGADTIDGTAGSTGVTLTNAKRCAYTVIGGVFISAQLGAVSG